MHMHTLNAGGFVFFKHKAESRQYHPHGSLQSNISSEAAAACTLYYVVLH